ncbi:hypothetical protein HTZ97_09430 [Desulfuromonas acetoxidans]|uniref:Uncharacterized protein n=1 Tax=Desulfuromonas acetoxidans (strain DSM 684 / 11070) TaxID=281689 RepID=Q1K2B0_DESA6|nr:hypothetical protein [Desulfuromonas acetoxidans]EAT16529.1 conserved hypothetical protein [Desulfuromonas acetoxidans DSM 684]MBF0647059.1 hypothetical protein [Desulfuromonas acetoxidans]NVD24641.1 hypothetical protein [Desulfuromonas acetoxidans]NVE16686.1 hypothetical protein [Desulfuromonas acetoxidans]
MADKNNKFWFPAKKYGFGWGFPITWQGWLVLLTYFILILPGAFFLDQAPWLIMPYILYTLVLSGILIFICWKKGENPDTHWKHQK